MYRVGEKVPSKEDSPSGQVAFDSHWFNGKEIRQVHCQLNHKSAKFFQGKKNLSVDCPKGKMEFKCFLSPEIVLDYSM